MFFPRKPHSFIPPSQSIAEFWGRTKLLGGFNQELEQFAIESGYGNINESVPSGNLT